MHGVHSNKRARKSLHGRRVEAYTGNGGVVGASRLLNERISMRLNAIPVTARLYEHHKPERS